MYHAELRRQQGIALIEVMIALLVFMIGALGFVGFISRSIADSNEASVQSQAATVAQDFFTRLDNAMSTADRSGPVAAYNAGLRNVTPAVFASWQSQALNASGSGLPNATAAYKYVDYGTSVQVQLTINWQIRASSTEGAVAGSPARTYTTQRPVI